MQKFIHRRLENYLANIKKIIVLVAGKEGLSYHAGVSFGLARAATAEVWTQFADARSRLRLFEQQPDISAAVIAVLAN